MLTQLVVGIFILVVAIAMTMVGKGGGNFYVVNLALANIPMHEAAATGQFILFAASAAAVIFFQTQEVVSWPLTILLGGLTSLSALGFFSHYFSRFTLKMVFAVMLILAGAMILIPVKEKNG